MALLALLESLSLPQVTAQTSLSCSLQPALDHLLRVVSAARPGIWGVPKIDLIFFFYISAKILNVY